MPKLLQAKRAGSERSMIVEDLLAMRAGRQDEAVTAIIRMVGDLALNGRESCFVKALHGTPV